MLKLDLFDESFDINRTESYELSIQLSLDGFSFAINDSVRNCFIALVSQPNEKHNEATTNWVEYCKRLVSQQSLLSKRFKKVTFCFETPNYTIVPKDFFEPQRAKQFLEMLVSIPELDEIRFSTLPNGIVSVFSLPSSLATEWLKLHPKTTFAGPGDHLLVPGNLSNNEHILISYNNVDPYLAFYKNGQTIHCGSIYATNAEDVAYHTLNICQKVEFSIPETYAYIVGTNENVAQLESILKKYTKSVKSHLPQELHQYTYQLLRHKNAFAYLFNLSLCG
jgi:hypothetical protein